MSEHNTPELELGQWRLGEGIGDQYKLKSIGNLSEKKPIHDMKTYTGDPKITNLTFIEANRNNYDIGSYVHDNDQPLVLGAHEIDQSIVPEDTGKTHHTESGKSHNKDNISVDHEQNNGAVSGNDVNEKIAESHETYHSVVSGDDSNDTMSDDNEHDYAVVSGDNDNDTMSDDHEQDYGLVSGDDDNDTMSDDHEEDYGLVSGDNDNDTMSDDHAQDYGLVSGDDENDTMSDDHEEDYGLVSENDDDDMVSEDHELGVASGDNGNKSVTEDHDKVNTSFVNDEEDMAFSFKNLFSCVRVKAKNKETNHYQSMTNDKENQLLIDPFRKKQLKFLKKIHKPGYPSHPPTETIKSCGVHESGVIGASTDTSMQSGKINYGITHTGNVHFEDLRVREYDVNTRHEASNGIDPDQYNFSHPRRGYAVIIVNKNFSRLDVRNGAEIDVPNTTMVLQRLGFFIKNKKLLNLDKQSALTVLQDAKYADHSKMDSFAFIISSHGNEIENPRNGKKEHAIYCSDDQYIFTNDILEMFSDENCPSLKGKPKLFFIQACRGTNIDSGVEIITVDGSNQNHIGVHNSSHHYRKNLEMDPKGFANTSEERPLVHCNNDCLVMYAIPSGYFAWRSNMDGSWMLHYLWEQVKNYNFRKPCSFLKVLTAINRKMANRETNAPGKNEKSGKKAIPVIIHQLDKDIVFQEKKAKR